MSVWVERWHCFSWMLSTSHSCQRRLNHRYKFVNWVYSGYLFFKNKLVSNDLLLDSTYSQGPMKSMLVDFLSVDLDARKWMNDSCNKVSCQFVLNPQGKIYRFVGTQRLPLALVEGKDQQGRWYWPMVIESVVHLNQLLRQGNGCDLDSVA